MQDTYYIEKIHKVDIVNMVRTEIKQNTKEYSVVLKGHIKREKEQGMDSKIENKYNKMVAKRKQKMIHTL